MTFEEIYSQHQQYVAAICWRFVDSHQDLEDAMQDTWLRVWNGLGSFRADSDVRTWLFTIAKNSALTLLRNMPEPAVSLEEKVNPHGSHRSAITTWADTIPARGLSPEETLMLPALREIEPILLMTFEGLTTEEMAQALGKSQNAVKCLKHRARRRAKARAAKKEPQKVKTTARNQVIA